MSFFRTLFGDAFELASVLQQIDRETDPDRLAELCARALALVSREDDPVLWARLHVKLGHALGSSVRIGPPEAVERQIRHFEQALAVFTPEETPLLWGVVEHGLGEASLQRVKGDRATNVERAIGHFRKALTVRDRSRDPERWASTTMALAKAHLVSPVQPTASLQQAIALYRELVEVLPRGTPAWGRACNGLASAYAYLRTAEQAENVRQAIFYFGQARTALTPDTSPEEWAEITANLASFYPQSDEGNRADNFEEAIRLYGEALRVLTPESHPLGWAIVTGNLAATYLEREKGARGENIETAIALQREAFEVLTPQNAPQEWATGKVILASAYLFREYGDRAENLETAIGEFEEVRRFYDQSGMPVQCAQATNNLAGVYILRIRGDRAENVEQAIRLLKDTLAVFSPDEIAYDWAQTMMNLGVAYRNRLRGDPANNIDTAIGYYREALHVRTRESMPDKWAETTLNLALALAHSLNGDRRENLEEAIRAHQAAFEVLSADAAPVRWATNTMNLASVYLHRIEGDPVENAARAIRLYQDAFRVFTPEAAPLEWAMNAVNLADAYLAADAEVRGENDDRAAGLLQEAQTIFAAAGQLPMSRDTLARLGNLYFRRRDWEEALVWYDRAVEAFSDALTEAYSEAARKEKAALAAQVFTNSSYCLVQAGRLGDALVRLEAGKTRLLAEALASVLVDAEDLVLGEREALLAATQRIRALEFEYRLADEVPAARGPREIAGELGEAYAQLRALAAEIQARHPRFMPAALPLQEILVLAPANGAMVAPLVTSQGTVVFVLPHGAERIDASHVVTLPDVTEETVTRMLTGGSGHAGWLGAYLDYRAGTADRAGWTRVIEATVGQVWEHLLAPVVETLRQLRVSRILLLPHGSIRLLPLHAARDGGGRRYLMDEFTVTYAPSAYVLAVARRRQEELAPGRAVVGGAGTYGPGFPDLPFARMEARLVASLLGATPLLDEALTRDALFAAAPSATVLHLGCHGVFAWHGDPLASGLVLTGGERVTLSEIAGRLKLGTAALVTLSACESGIIEIREAPDEFVGLPAGFMQAGARGVVSTLWTVDDLSTVLLMQRFYGLVGESASPAGALRSAQLWLRNATRSELAAVLEPHLADGDDDLMQGYLALMLGGEPEDRVFELPFYWAAFVFNGAEEGP